VAAASREVVALKRHDTSESVQGRSQGGYIGIYTPKIRSSKTSEWLLNLFHVLHIVKHNEY